jgi:oligopeptide transport system substrate-binding protein
MGLCPLSELGVKALDPYTLQVELTHPASYFLTLTATHAFFPLPKHIVHSFTDFADNAGPHYVGNGPFLSLQKI